jgi:hypothetical protein
MLVPFRDLAFACGGNVRTDPRHPRLRKKLRARDVLLTVPHGAPGNDVLAPDVACPAHEQLRERGIDSLLLLARICRYTECDMNRPQARRWPYRQAVRVAMKEKPRLLLDVHSFPNAYPAYKGRDMVMIHTPGVTDKKAMEEFAGRLKAAAKEIGRKAVIEVQDQHQQVIHDIVTEAKELGLPSKSIMLVECNESGSPALYSALIRKAIMSMALDHKWIS